MKKLILCLVVLMSMLMLSGCGASVTSKTDFNSEGGGTRAISAVISASDAKNLTNGFDELDTLLKQAAPSGVNVNRTNLDNGDAKYQFTIQFSNIDDYNQKISAITGTNHNATWYAGTNVFQSNVEFSEEDCTYQLISWAIDAFKDSKYSAFSSHFTLYDVTKSEFYFNNQLVYSGTGNPSFTVKTSPNLIKVNVYSDFSYDNESKKVELLFEQGSLERIDLENARRNLERISPMVSIDTANSSITYHLKNRDEILSFLKNADVRNGDECLSYEFVNNPFQKKYILKENYYLTGLLTLFSMADTNVYMYVKLPEVTKETYFTQAGQAIETPGQYDYGSCFHKDYGYSMETSSNHMVDLKSINVTYDVTKDLKCKRTIEVTYIKNDCAITENQLAGYFPNIEERVSFFDAGDTIRLVFVSQQMNENALRQGFGFEKLSRQNLKYVRHMMQDNLDLSRYLPVIEGYSWNMGNMRYNYQVNIEDNAGLYKVNVGKQEYSDTDNSLTQFASNNAYNIKGSDSADHYFVIELYFKQLYQMFYFWIIFIVFIIIVVVLGVTLYYTKKKSLKTEKVLELE